MKMTWDKNLQLLEPVTRHYDGRVLMRFLLFYTLIIFTERIGWLAAGFRTKIILHLRKIIIIGNVLQQKKAIEEKNMYSQSQNSSDRCIMHNYWAFNFASSSWSLHEASSDQMGWVKAAIVKCGQKSNLIWLEEGNLQCEKIEYWYFRRENFRGKI